MTNPILRLSAGPTGLAVIEIRTNEGSFAKVSSGEQLLADGYYHRLCHVGITTQFTITNYHFSDNYVVSTTNGVVSISGNVVSYTPATAGSGGFWINTSYHAVTVSEYIPDTPAISDPKQYVSEVTVIKSTDFWLSASAFHSPAPEANHYSTTWQIATDADFTSLVFDVTSTTDLTQILVTGVPNGSYYARVRYTEEVV